MIAQQDGPIFNDALTEINLTSPAAVRALQWFADYGRANVGPEASSTALSIPPVAPAYHARLVEPSRMDRSS